MVKKLPPLVKVFRKVRRRIGTLEKRQTTLRTQGDIGPRYRRLEAELEFEFYFYDRVRELMLEEGLEEYL